MIKYITGNIFDSNAQALVNTVNTVGVMGKGIALQFKKEFPKNYKKYVKACKDKSFSIGKLLVIDDESIYTGRKIIINFPTKKNWRNPSEYSYIEEGLNQLVELIQQKSIKSIAIPPLGAGNGGLDWKKVKAILESKLKSLNCDVFIYEPNFIIKEVMKKERVRLTPARAMLLSVLYELVRNGEFVSEFTAEKVAYFLQKFGAKKVMNLDFKPNFYGPYSGKVKHVLYYLNGSYIMGYSSKDRKPFEELSIILDTEKAVNDFLQKKENVDYNLITYKTKEFLKGFYSPFSLELLSTIDYIKTHNEDSTLESITTELNNWSDRKKTMFNNQRFVELAVNHIEKFD